jgi:gamma-glutamyl-gamma-aminobutyrate hydrolase PuuD
MGHLGGNMNIAIPIGSNEEKFSINQAYVNYVAGAGYEPLLVSLKNNVNAIAKLADGLLLPGGIDIDPMSYGESNWGSFYCDPMKDHFERELMWAFAIAGKPVFGICRGFQIIAREYMYHGADVQITKTKTVADRMSFRQHVDDHEMTGRFHLFRTIRHHFVDARVDALYGLDEKMPVDLGVNSMHHQAVYLNMSESWLATRSNKISQHAKALAWTTRGLDSDDEGVICEALSIEGWSNAPMMGVQWHPEELEDYNLLKNFFGKFENPVKTIAKEE